MTFPWLPLELTYPGAALVGLVVLPVLVVYYARSLIDFPRWQRALSLACRVVIAALLILALGGLTLLTPTRQQYVLIAIDRSKSIGDEAREQVTSYIEQAVAASGTDKVAFLPFAAVPGQVKPDAPGPPQELADEATDLAAAIEVASAAIPPSYVPKIVVLSDGNQTAGDAIRAALRSEATVSTVPLASRDDPEVQVSAVGVPAQTLQGEPFGVEIVVDANHKDAGRLEVYRDDILVEGASRDIELVPGENRFRFEQTLERGGLTRYTVRARGFRDTLLDNNDEFGLVYTSGKPRVLMVNGDERVDRSLTWALEDQGMQVDVRPPRGLPEVLADLQNYDLLILSNVPATALTMRQMDVARTYVQDLGGGLIMLGGDQSFGLGGYYKTAIEEILPVRSDFEKEKEKPSLAMVLIIDKSGSMGGMKIEMAKEAARSAVELLGPSDKVGVLAFEGSPFWISEIHPCTDKGYVIDRVASLEAGGGTNMAPAMEEAYEALRHTVAKLKHVIILTDGISAPGDFEGITQSMRQERITVSTVGIGEGAHLELLAEIARIGDGRHYEVLDPSSVPQIFAKETVTASKSAINEMPFLPQVVRASTALKGLDLESAPFLLGFVVTRPKPTSEVILATETGEPLLAWWRYGLGRSVAFTSDAKSRWAADWVATWPDFSTFWAQVARYAMRPAETRGTVVQIDRQGTEARVRLDAIDSVTGTYLNNADGTLTLIDPVLGTRSLDLAQTAPGRYETSFETPSQGAYLLEFALKKNGHIVSRQSRGLAVGYPDELRLRPTDEDLLKTIANVSGGSYDPSPAEVFAPSERTARRPVPLWPYLVAVALSLFVLDVALRRIDLSLWRPARRAAPLPSGGG